MKGEKRMPYGYNGTILRVDLTKATITEENLSEKVYRQYMGGSALSLYFLLKEMKPEVDPLGPENLLVFMSNARFNPLHGGRPVTFDRRLWRGGSRWLLGSGVEDGRI